MDLGFQIMSIEEFEEARQHSGGRIGSMSYIASSTNPLAQKNTAIEESSNSTHSPSNFSAHPEKASNLIRSPCCFDEPNGGKDSQLTQKIC
jgi:hypothetical protein